MKLGRRRPIARGPRLSLKNYLMKALPAPPASCGYAAKAAGPLSQVYLNDKLGDCVIAGMAHVEGVLTAGAGSPYVFSEAEITALYGAIGGYVPGDPSTDQGCDEITALNYWQHKGAPAGLHKITGYLAVDAGNPTEWRTALWLFENLFFGLELPDAWIDPEPAASGFTWDVAGDPNPNNGHCVVGVGYNEANVAIATWGMLGVMTDAALAKYAGSASNGELFTILSEDAINKATAKAPNGFAFAQLQADFKAIGR